MLLRNSRWHFASNRLPEREARLLAFADANKPDPSGTPQTQADKLAEEKAWETQRRAELSNMAPDAIQREMLIATEKTLRRQDQGAQPTSTTAEEGTAPETVAAGEEIAEDEKEKGESGEVVDQTEAESELQNKEALRKKFDNLIEKSSEHIQKIDDIKARMENEDLLKRLKMVAPADVVKKWEADISALNKESFNAAQELQFTRALQSFWEGEMPPRAFLAEQGEYMRNLPYGFSDVGTLLHLNIRDQDTSDATTGFSKEKWETPEQRAEMEEKAWQTANASDRIQTINKFMENIQLETWINEMTGQYKGFEKTIKTQDTFVQSMENNVEEMDFSQGEDGASGFLSQFKSIRWMSINNYLQGAQKWWSALKKAWEDKDERYSADIARKIGKALLPFDFMPLYGQEVYNILDQQLDAKRNEESEGIKKQLESDGARWLDVFGDGSNGKVGIFHKFKDKNPNKARGILEYAADHGFLYKIDEVVNNPKFPIYGRNLADICSDWTDNPTKINNYFSILRSKNSAGREKEMDGGYKKEHANENVPRFMELIENEMNDHNLWAAAGICKRAMERGLEGEVSAWVLTTVMAKLREFPELRKVTPVIFFDLIGKEAQYNTAFTLGWAKVYRPQLGEYCRTGDESILEKTELRYFKSIEKEIIRKDPNTDYSTGKGKADLNRKIAQVLAGQIVSLPGGYIHIFESKYQSYREKVKTSFASVADPFKEDSDYARETTEKSMLPHAVVAKILHYSSTDEFTGKDWVDAYLGSIIAEAVKLRNIPELEEAHRNYTNEIRQRMDLHFNGYIHSARILKQLSTLDGKQNLPAIAYMVTENLLSLDVIKKNPEAFKAISVQFWESFPDFAAANNIPKPEKEKVAPTKKNDAPGAEASSL